jgi:hypothetical protein
MTQICGIDDKRRLIRSDGFGGAVDNCLRVKVAGSAKRLVSKWGLTMS